MLNGVIFIYNRCHIIAAMPVINQPCLARRNKLPLHSCSIAWCALEAGALGIRPGAASGGEMTAEIVNLRKARKEAKKREDAERAAANRIAYGRTKAQRESHEGHKNKLSRHLDGHKIDPGET
jgi:hypothetical protein